MKLTYKIFSSIFILINIIFITFCYFFARQGYLEGAPGWVLAIWGAPTSFLYFLIFKFSYKLFVSMFSQYLIISLLFQLQYQLIVYFLFKIKFKRIFTKILISIMLFIIIVFSAKKMRMIVVPSSQVEWEESKQFKDKFMGKLDFAR